MDDPIHPESLSPTLEWRRVLFDLPVTFVWAYDTVAILPEYDDSENGILPAGQIIRFSEVAENPAQYLCDLDNPRFIEKTALPARRIQRFRPWCFATPLQALIKADDFLHRTISGPRPSRLQRLLRRIK